ncbi:hypothetical protein HWV62_12086 [Athelia sp. TMB]|nr:hypothetical protein HWV62_12086 [Athelia sp. TMB]
MYPNQRDVAVSPIFYHADSQSFEPPVHDILHKNLPPQSDIASIDEEIRVSQIHTAPSRLVAKLTALCDPAAASKGLISPPRRLPAEILGEIFIHTLPPFPFELFPSQTPLVLELVCRRWKDVIRSTPALWSSIALRLHKRSGRRDLAVASTCLARSGRHPLSISLELEWQSLRYRGSDRGYPALALIVAHCERWQTVYVEFQLMNVLSELADVQGRLVSLERLHVTSFTADNTPFEVFGLAPRLRFLDITATGYKYIIWGGAFGLPWKGLTTLVIDERHTNEVLGMLADCQNLVYLKALISDYTCPAGIDGPTIQLAHLRSISLTLPEVPTILPKLILPALTQISFTTITTKNSRQDLWHVSTGLDILLSQSGCVVRELALDDKVERLEARDLVGILTALPSLTELRVSDGLKGMLQVVSKDREEMRNGMGSESETLKI